jgi:hypothetical protein
MSETTHNLLLFVSGVAIGAALPVATAFVIMTLIEACR